MIDDERLANIEKQRQTALNESNNVYNNLIADNKKLYEQQNNYANEYEKTQNDILDKRLAYNQEQIEKQKEEARKNYEIEGKKAKNEYTSFINPYGYNAESMAQNGLNNSGLAESTKLGAYNTYQNRLATANKVMQDAFTAYDSEINQARLENDVQKAQNALNKLQLQLDYVQNYYNNNSNLAINKLNASQSVDNNYYNRYQDAINQINYEKEQEEKRRQYEEQFAYQKAQDALAQSNWERQYTLSQQSNSGSNYYYSNLDDYSTALVDNNSNNSGNTNSSNNDTFGNSTSTINKGDYYFSNGYQPRYVNNQKLSEIGVTVGEVFGDSYGSNRASQNIWKTNNNRYYIWLGNGNKGGDYVDVTQYAKEINSKKTLGDKILNIFR